MKKIMAFLLAAVLAIGFLPGCKNAAPETPGADALRDIVDMAGRRVQVPQQIESVFSANPASAIYLYTLAPEVLLGWNYQLNDLEKSIILEKYHALPNFGQRDAVNFEAVIAAAPSVVLNVGTINEKLISECEDLQQRLGIPVIAVDGDLLRTAEAYRFLGDLLGMEEAAEPLAAYADETFRQIQAMDIPESELVRVYYGNGQDSLETAPKGSAHGQILELVRAVNVADLELGDGARVQISPEQLLAWDPDVILVNGEPKADLSGSAAAEALMADPVFASLTAVQTRQVYGIPNAPFNWLDRPPGPNRVVGIRWLSGLLYPEKLDFNADESVKEFFRLFYHVELTDERLAQIYKGIYYTDSQ